MSESERSGPTCLAHTRLGCVTWASPLASLGLIWETIVAALCVVGGHGEQLEAEHQALHLAHSECLINVHSLHIANKHVIQSMGRTCFSQGLDLSSHWLTGFKKHINTIF